MVKAFVLVMYVIGQGGYGNAKGDGRTRWYADQDACRAAMKVFIDAAAHDPNVKRLGFGCVSVDISTIAKHAASL